MEESYYGKSGEIIGINHFSEGWKALQFSYGVKPEGISQWVNYLWGTDIWLGKIPFMKTVVLINVLVWLLFLIK